MSTSLPAARQLFADATTPTEMAERHEALVKAATEATVSGLSGETFFDGSHETSSPCSPNGPTSGPRSAKPSPTWRSPSRWTPRSCRHSPPH